jgi:hypothetical protein
LLRDGRRPLRAQSLAHVGPGRRLNVHEKDADDNTPLHWSAVRGHAKTTEYLVQCDAPVNAKNKDRDTPMHWACSGGNVEVIRLLQVASADVLARNSDNTTPLHFAAADGHAEAVGASPRLQRLRPPAPRSAHSARRAAAGATCALMGFREGRCGCCWRRRGAARRRW